MKQQQITRPVNGTCDSCQKKNCLVQKKLLVESMDAFDDRTDCQGDPKDRDHFATCKECFVIPSEEFEWDEDGDYQDLNQRNIIWDNGDWMAKPSF